eukprot:3248931-Prymnesium_polylepis.2
MGRRERGRPGYHQTAPGTPCGRLRACVACVILSPHTTPTRPSPLSRARCRDAFASSDINRGAKSC